MEVVIAAGLMGGVALGVMQLNQNTTNMQREAGYSGAIQSMESEVQKFLLNSDVCYATLGDLNFSAGTSINPTNRSVNVPVIQFAQRDEATGKLIASTINPVQELHDNNGAVPPDSNAGSMSGRLVFRKLYVTNLEWLGDSIPGKDPYDKTKNLVLRQAKLTLKGEFEKRTCAACGNRNAKSNGERPRVVNKFFYVNATLDTSNSNTLIKCYSAEGNAVVTALKASCEAIDFNQDGDPDMEYDETKGECVPMEGTASCIYGGSYATGSSTNYTNPATGAKTCPAGYTRVPAGHFMRPEEKKCGKSHCYNFYQQTYYNCVKCRTNPGSSGLPKSAGGAANGTNLGVGLVSGYAGCDGGACTATGGHTGGGCASDKSDAECQAISSFHYAADMDGDGCYESCFDYSSGIPGGSSTFTCLIDPTACSGSTGRGTGSTRGGSTGKARYEL
ncbi:MAG: hypothetical protein CME62_01135 [Halobacteriovoraceae bacterium]|nr:hypothetical protein [Halobacteriovoraceae bacterium]|tara:strand:- start:6239 stop:7576 length:1338 start_codon:yes stop_codon:yes gene_type:complete